MRSSVSALPPPTKTTTTTTVLSIFNRPNNLMLQQRNAQPKWDGYIIFISFSLFFLFGRVRCRMGVINAVDLIAFAATIDACIRFPFMQQSSGKK